MCSWLASGLLPALALLLRVTKITPTASTGAGLQCTNCAMQSKPHLRRPKRGPTEQKDHVQLVGLRAASRASAVVEGHEDHSHGQHRRGAPMHKLCNAVEAAPA